MAAVSEPGIYAMTAEQYHADPAPDPSLSASAAEAILLESPRHCWTRHAALNPLAEEERELERMNSQKRMRMEHGSALHTLTLGAGRGIMEIDADSYQSNKAREAREVATEEGYIPILSGDLRRLRACSTATREQILAHPDLGPVLNIAEKDPKKRRGQAEQALFWRERIGAAKSRTPAWLWCRALVDWLPDDPRAPLVDFKFTTTSAEPQSYGKTVREDLTLRSAHYLRGAQTLRSATPRAYWIVAVEMAPPFGLSVHRADNTLLHEAREQWMEAASRFHACLMRGRDAKHWPFWKAEINVVGMKPWQQQEWEDRKALQNIPEHRGASISARRARQFMQQTGSPMA